MGYHAVLHRRSAVKLDIGAAALWVEVPRVQAPAPAEPTAPAENTAPPSA